MRDDFETEKITTKITDELRDGINEKDITAEFKLLLNRAMYTALQAEQDEVGDDLAVYPHIRFWETGDEQPGTNPKFNLVSAGDLY